MWLSPSSTAHIGAATMSLARPRERLREIELPFYCFEGVVWCMQCSGILNLICGYRTKSQFLVFDPSYMDYYCHATHVVYVVFTGTRSGRNEQGNNNNDKALRNPEEMRRVCLKRESMAGWH